VKKKRVLHYTFKFLSIIELKPDWSFVEHYFEVIKAHKSRQAWWEKRKLRLEDHFNRISTELVKLEPASAQTSRGTPRGVWCVQLRTRFSSLTSAAKFAGCSTSNISRAIARHGRSGGFQWEHFNPRRHGHHQENR